MAKKRRWSRYQPPVDKRDEDGARLSAPRQPAKAASRTGSSSSSRSASSSKPKSKPTPKQSSTSETKLSSWIRTLIALAIITPIVVIIIVAVKAGDGGDGSNRNPDLDTGLLNREFIEKSLAQALEVEGKDAVALRLDEYGMSIEYFDPNERQRRVFETNDYIDGYTLQVEDSYYDDYMPRPFDLTVVDADTMIAAVNDALTRTDDIYTFRLLIEADRETGEVATVVTVSGDESVEVTSAP